MREFLYKNSFFRYAAAINLCGGKHTPVIAPFISFYVLMIISLVGGVSSLNFIGMGAAGIAVTLFFTGALIGAIRNAAPNLATLMPLSGKRKCVYDFLVVLYYAFIALLTVALFAGIIFLIVWAVVSSSGGFESEGESNPFTFSVGVYGGLFSVAYIIIMYSAGMISGSFKSRKRRNVFLAVFVICVALGVLFTGLSYLINAAPEAEISGIGSPFSSECYKYMKLPWLCILFWCLIAVGMFASAVYMCWKRHKPEKF